MKIKEKCAETLICRPALETTHRTECILACELGLGSCILCGFVFFICLDVLTHPAKLPSGLNQFLQLEY